MPEIKNNDFKQQFLDQVGFCLSKDQGYQKTYIADNNDQMIIYQKERCFELGIADYSIPHDFELTFNSQERLIRFGIVYHGTTSFQLDHEEFSSFSPSSFFVVEDHVSGKQVWKKGQHFHGIEVTLYADYLEKLLYDATGHSLSESVLETNYTYRYLPLKMTQCIQQLHALSNHGEMNSLYLESKILECVAILYRELFTLHGEAFINQTHMEQIMVGNRNIRLTATDLSAIQKSYEIITENIKNPPTIDMLSKMVLLNTQKLKAGFYHHYHMTIGEYITTVRMSTAAILLCTTNDHIHDIAAEVGYAHSANFIKAFQRKYQKTPLQYRNENTK